MSRKRIENVSEFWQFTKEAAVDAFYSYFQPIGWLYHQVKKAFKYSGN